MSNEKLIERAKKDLEFIFKSFNDGKFTYNNDFTEKTNHDLEELIVTDILTTKLEGGPKTETVLKLYNIKDIYFKQKKPFLWFITKKKGFVEVKIWAIVDYYWIVDGHESAIPGEIESSRIYKVKELSFNLRYREINGRLMLVFYYDDNGTDFGESRSWTGRPEIMKKYRENKGIINEK